MDIGKKIRKLRKAKKLTQGELAEKVGIVSAHLSRLELGHYKPSIDLVKNLADIFEVTTDYLLSDIDEEAPVVKIQDQAFSERIQLLNSLNEKDKEAIMHMIDALLTKKKIQMLIGEEKTLL